MATFEAIDGWMILLAWFKDYRRKSALADLVERTRDGGWVVGWSH